MFEEGTHRDLLSHAAVLDHSLCLQIYNSYSFCGWFSFLKDTLKKKKHINVAEMISSICFL